MQANISGHEGETAAIPRSLGASLDGDFRNPWYRSIWESFASDRTLQQLHRITKAEMRGLERVAKSGAILSKQDFVFVLEQTRAARQERYRMVGESAA